MRRMLKPLGHDERHDINHPHNPAFPPFVCNSLLVQPFESLPAWYATVGMHHHDDVLAFFYELCDCRANGFDICCEVRERWGSACGGKRRGDASIAMGGEQRGGLGPAGGGVPGAVKENEDWF